MNVRCVTGWKFFNIVYNVSFLITLNILTLPWCVMPSPAESVQSLP